MSVRVMSLVWAIDLPASQKIVLLALADCANDEGHAWPGMASLAAKCSKSERTVQTMLGELEKAGHITRKQVLGKGCNYYVHPGNYRTPAKSAPPQETAETPAKSAPKPSRTITSGLSSDKPARAYRRKDWPEIPDWVPVEPWNGFVDMRKRKDAMPSPRAVGLLIAKLARLRDHGHDPGSVLDTSTENNWTGLFQPKETNVRPLRPADTLGSLRGTRPDPALDMLYQAQRDLAAEADSENERLGGPPRLALPAGQSGRP